MLRIDKPTLVLEWSRATDEDERCDFVCTYYLAIPVDKYDIRNAGDGIAKATFGKTRVNMERTPLNSNGTVMTPFRDGCHIKWDSLALGGLPMLAVWGNHETELTHRDDDAVVGVKP